MAASGDEPRIVRHDVVDSTSERAFAEIAAARARNMDVHVARGQTIGRGRLGRAWDSPPGAGLYASFVLMPPGPWNPAALTIALGLSVLDVVHDLGATHAALKWPNDVVVDRAKLAGVLAETRDLDPRRPCYVAGIGVNVARRDFPAALVAERPVTSLAASGVSCSVDDVLRRLVRAVPERCAQIEFAVERLESDFVRAAGLRECRVRAEVASGPLLGELVRLSIAEGLVIRPDFGAEMRFALEHVRALAPI